jgi:hypothetical protein
MFYRKDMGYGVERLVTHLIETKNLACLSAGEASNESAETNFDRCRSITSHCNCCVGGPFTSPRFV